MFDWMNLFGPGAGGTAGLPDLLGKIGAGMASTNSYGGGFGKGVTDFASQQQGGDEYNRALNAMFGTPQPGTPGQSDPLQPTRSGAPMPSGAPAPNPLTLNPMPSPYLPAAPGAPGAPMLSIPQGAQGGPPGFAPGMGMGAGMGMGSGAIDPSAFGVANSVPLALRPFLAGMRGR